MLMTETLKLNEFAVSAREKATTALARTATCEAMAQTQWRQS
jgi:hypothetical protein